MLQIDLILQMLQTPRDWFIISLEGIGMTVLNAIAEETDRGRMLKSFVRGKMGVSYAQYSAAKRESDELVRDAHRRAKGGSRCKGRAGDQIAFARFPR